MGGLAVPALGSEEKDASGKGAGRYSQVKHQEHEARRLVGIDESDWGKRQRAERRWEGAGAYYGAFHPKVTVGC